MVVATAQVELFLHSADASWDRTRWEALPDDGGRYEIIDGVLYMSTASSPFHQWVSSQIQRLLSQEVDLRDNGITFTAPTGLFMPGGDPVQPDHFVISTEDRPMILERRIETIPLLIVEILSPSSQQYDTITKRQAYARAGVPEYWILRPQERDLLIHSEPKPTNSQYLQMTRIAEGGEIISPTLSIRAALADIFALTAFQAAE